MRRWLGAGLIGLLLTAIGPSALAVEGQRELTFSDPAITESSGLVVRDDLVLTVNDSGDGPVVYVVDAATGATVGRTTYTSDAVVDVEALAPGPRGGVWVGDIGDNDRDRAVISIYRLPALARGDRTVTAQRFDLAYPDGAHDAETLLVHPRTGRVLVVSKGLFSGEIYRAPATLAGGEVNRLQRVGKVGGLVTDGTFLPDGRTVVLRDYGDGAVYDARTWDKRGGFALPDQPQAEAVAVRAADGRLLLSSEGEHEPVLSVAVPARLLPAAQASDPAQPSADAPTSDPATLAAEPDEPAADKTTPPARSGLVPVLAGGVFLVLVTLVAFAALRARVRRVR